MTGMKISVAMATYNGEQYLKEQLASILAQTIPVDEIIISDDGSSDRTVSVVSEFQDPRIRLITGNPKKGACGNFEYALKHTTGDVIFLCDQDDIWRPDKVKKNLEVMVTNPQIELVITNAAMIDQRGHELDGKGDDINRQITPHLYGVPTGKLPCAEFLGRSIHCTLAHGMRMCLRRSLLSLILPFPDSGRMHHDRWIGFCGLKNDSVYYLDEKLVQYRIHGSNISIKNENDSFSKRLIKMLSDAYHAPYDIHNMSCSMLDILPENDEHYASVYSALQGIYDDTAAMIRAHSQNPFRGTASIVKLRQNSEYYANFGMKSLVLHICLLVVGRRYMKKHPRMMQERKKRSDTFSNIL